MRQKLLLLLLGVLSSLPALARDFDYTYEGQTITYTVLDEDAKTCQTKSGYTDNNGYGYAGVSVSGNVILPENPKDGDVEFTLTRIGELSFFGAGLSSVIIPNTVTAINYYAFSYCSSLVTVLVGNSVTAIGSYAFLDCGALKKSAYPNTLKNPFENGVAVAYNPEGAILEDGWIWGPEKSEIRFVPWNLEGEYAIPKSVTSIGGYAFEGCSGMTSVEISNSVETIGDSAFSGCSGLKSVAFNAENCKVCGSSKYPAFPETLETLVIGEKVTKIPGYAFEGCSGLTSVEIPNSVTSIGDYAFVGCRGLTSVEIPNSVQTIGKSAFYDCSGLISTVIGESVTTIGKNAFEGCNIASLTFNAVNCNTEKSSNISVFPNTLETLVIGDKVRNIPEYSFYGCSKLTSVVIPNSLTSIGKYAFYGCSGLNTMTALPVSPAVMNDNSFEGLYDTVKLSVPDEAVSNYLATNWSLFKNIQNNSGKEVGYFSDGILEYRLNPSDMTAMVIGAKSYSNIQIPERFTDDTDAANPVRYYIKGIGYKAFYGKDVNSLEFNSRSQMEYIGDYAFANTKINSITLPETMNTIGDYAFYRSKNLSRVELNQKLASIGKYAFAETNISSITLPEIMKTIGDYAFYLCENLSRVEFNQKLASIGKYAFAETNISSIDFPMSVKSIGDYAFYNTYQLNDVKLWGVETIGESAFAAAKKRNTTCLPLQIPTTLKTIGKDAFQNFVCSKVYMKDFIFYWLNINFGNEFANPLSGSIEGLYDGYADLGGPKVTELFVDPHNNVEIRPYSFYGCNSLEKLTIREGVRKIGTGSFLGCNITEVTIPSSVVEIGASAFELKNVTFADGLNPITLGEEAFCNYVTHLYWGRPIESLTLSLSHVNSLVIGNHITEIPDRRFRDMKYLKSLSLGNSVETIGNRSFSGCSNLTDLNLVSSPVQTIGDEAFSGCTRLEEVILPPSVETIGASAFSGCTSLAEVILPPSVETIGASAFSGNSKLESIIMGYKVKSIGEKAFDGCKANTVCITAQTPPTAPNNTFSNYRGKLYVQGEKAKDAYYDAFTCWDRFDSYVMIDAEKITIEGADKISGKAGDTFQLTATVWPENVTLPQIFWRSTNPEIATVDANGLVTLHVDLNSLDTRASGEGDIDGACTIIAETLYDNGPVAEIGIDTTGLNVVESITVGDNGSIDYSLPYDVYNMDGFKVGDSTEGLVKGIYIIRQGKAVVKTVVR